MTTTSDLQVFKNMAAKTCLFGENCQVAGVIWLVSSQVWMC